MASIRLIYDNNLSKQDNIIVIDDTKKDMYINLHLESSDFVGLQYQMNYLATNYINNQDYKDFNIYVTADGNSRIFINDDNKTVTIYKKNDFPNTKNIITIKFQRNVYSDEKTNLTKETNNPSVSTAGVRLITSQFAKFLEYNSDLIDWVLYFPKDTNPTKPTITITDGVYFSTDKKTISVPNKSVLPLDWFSDHGLRILEVDGKKIASLNMLGESSSGKGPSYNWAEYIDKKEWDKLLSNKFDNIKKFRKNVIDVKETVLDRTTYITNLLKTYNENIKKDLTNTNNLDLLLETYYIKFILDLIDTHPRWDNDYKNKHIELYEPKLIGDKNDSHFWFPFPPSGITKKYFSDTHLRELKLDIMNIHLPPGIHIDDIVTYNKYSNELIIKNEDINSLTKKLTVVNKNYTENLLKAFIDKLNKEIINNEEYSKTHGLKRLVQRDFYFCFKFYSDLINNAHLKDNIFNPLYETMSQKTIEHNNIINDIMDKYGLHILGLQEVNNDIYDKLDKTKYYLYSIKNIDMARNNIILNTVNQDGNYEYKDSDNTMIFSKNKSYNEYNEIINRLSESTNKGQYKDTDKIYIPTNFSEDKTKIDLQKQKTFGVFIIKK